MEAINGIHDRLQPAGLCDMHGTAAEAGEAIAKAVHHVDVTGPLRDAFLQNTRPLVGQRQCQSIDNFLLTDGPRCYPELRPGCGDDLCDGGIFLARARVGAVSVITRSGFLSQPASLDQTIRQQIIHAGAFFLIRELLSGAVTNIDTRQVPHRHGAHRHSPALHCLIDLRGRGTLHHTKCGLTAVVAEHTIANKSVAHA